MSFPILPKNLQLNIFDFCNLNELSCLSCVAKYFNTNIIDDKHYDYWNKRILLNDKRNLMGLIKNYIINHLVWHFIYKLNPSLLTYNVEEKIKRLLNLNETVDISGFDLIIPVNPLNLCHLLDLEVCNNDLYYHNKKYNLNKEYNLYKNKMCKDNPTEEWWIDDSLKCIINIIKNKKNKINDLVEIYEKKLDIYMKLSLTKKYFDKFRVGQKVKLINLPSHLYFISCGCSKKAMKTEEYISEGEIGYILPMEHESISYQLSYYNNKHFMKNYQRKYFVYLKDKIVRFEEKYLFSEEKYNLR